MSKEKDVDLEAGETHPYGHNTSLHHFAEVLRSISNEDAAERYREEAADNGVPTNSPLNWTVSQDNAAKVVISWDENDPENPYNWSRRKKLSVLVTTMILIVNSTMGSSLPSMAIPYMTAEWGVTSQAQKVLPLSTYLIGYVFGPIFWGPLTEHVGRRFITVLTYFFFLIWTMACALAPNWPALLVFRFLTGAVASAPIAIVAGFLADIYDNPVERGRAFGWFMAMTVFGPLFAPIISGFCSTSIGWRWTFWVGLIYAGFSSIPLFFLPETYAPVLLSRRAARMRKENPEAPVYAAAELERRDFKQLATVVLTRPIRMIISELIVTSTCMYLALCYSIFYMSFQAFPLIFESLYGLSPGVTGLCFLPIGGGSLLSLVIFYVYDMIRAKAEARNLSWTKKEEFRRLPLACLGGPLFVVSLFWLGWSAKADVSFVAPMLAGIPFGCGFLLIFMALLNYLTDAYEVYAASANAAASASRSLFAVVLPLATTPMFNQLGIAGACSLLGGLSALMCIIPFIFIWKGEQIRSRSRFCIALKEQKVEMARKAEEYRQRKARIEARRQIAQEREQERARDAAIEEERVERTEKKEVDV